MATPSASASIALDRFGLGARPGDRVGSDPRAWVEAQLARYQPRPPALSGQPTLASLITRFADYREQSAMARRENQAMKEASGARAQDPLAGEVRMQLKALREIYVSAANARLASAVATDAPFPEALVHFWSNHFAISADKVAVFPLAGNYEFEAIRPHVMGNFRDILGAAVLHPAMMVFLDQAQSIGPGSPLATRVGRMTARMGKALGLNENLGREILELHTLGVRTGYSQADVTEFARALTGWTIAGYAKGRLEKLAPGTPGEAVFATALHEPGARTILGKRYPDTGGKQALAILDDLARHPATARHVATKLARRFIADAPPPAAIARIEKAFLASDGDLPTVYRALLASPEAWEAQPGKFRTPWDWTVATLRATGLTQLANKAGGVGLLQQMGQAVWRPGSPAGWPDTMADYAGPGALMMRVEIAQQIATRLGDRLDARGLVDAVLPDASAETRQAITRSESPALGLAVMLSSPEFLRR